MERSLWSGNERSGDVGVTALKRVGVGGSYQRAFPQHALRLTCTFLTKGAGIPIPFTDEGGLSRGPGKTLWRAPPLLPIPSDLKLDCPLESALYHRSSRPRPL